MIAPGCLIGTEYQAIVSGCLRGTKKWFRGPAALFHARPPTTQLHAIESTWLDNRDARHGQARRGAFRRFAAEVPFRLPPVVAKRTGHYKADV
jgi:hypothetical protein